MTTEWLPFPSGFGSLLAYSVDATASSVRVYDTAYGNFELHPIIGAISRWLHTHPACSSVGALLLFGALSPFVRLFARLARFECDSMGVLLADWFDVDVLLLCQFRSMFDWHDRQRVGVLVLPSHACIFVD